MSEYRHISWQCNNGEHDKCPACGCACHPRLVEPTDVPPIPVTDQVLEEASRARLALDVIELGVKGFALRYPQRLHGEAPRWSPSDKKIVRAALRALRPSRAAP